MCDLCGGVGLLDQVDGDPVRFVRTVACPRRCDGSWDALLYMDIEDKEWRVVCEDDPIHQKTVHEERYVNMLELVTPAPFEATQYDDALIRVANAIFVNRIGFAGGSNS